MLKDTMVFLQCDNGSKVVRVACPTCGRISSQILKETYQGTETGELTTDVKCPVCSTLYHGFSKQRSEKWIPIYQRYADNLSAYNSAAKDNYIKKQTPSKYNSVVAFSEWTDLFQMTILNRGKTYARRGTVRNLVRTDISYTATVEGTQNYQVKIGIEKGGISSLNCTCPYAAKGEMCKHMAAVLYIAVDGIQETATANTISPPPVSKPESNHDIQKLASILQYRANTEPRSTSVRLSADKNTRPAEHSYDQVTEASEANPTDIALERKVNRWKKELLDTGKRNKMINYRETSRTTLKILEPGLEELFNKLAISEKELSFQKPINKDSDFRTYAFLSLLETLSYNLPVHVGDIKAVGTIVEREKTLKNLRAKTKLAREEQGTNILYLSFGFILWRENDRPSSTWMKAPLLMMPVSLEMKSLNAPYTISRYEDDIEVNPTLDYLLNAEYGIDLPAFELKDKKSITTYLDMIEEIIDRRGWKLIREVSLGLLSFQKINMYHDLNNDHNQQLIVKHPVLRAMSGDYSAVKGIPEELQGMNFDSINPKNCYQVVNADSSQQDAIMLSKSGVSFVMQGPPGTGKSQTITNIIAEALADGKKVLFVSEKAAALQVVLKRLTEVGLSDFCLSLHDYKANKKVIIDNIGANLELTAPRISRADIGKLTELLHSRAYLNVYAEELHKSIAPLECSIYTAYGRITQLSDATVVECNIIDPMAITKDTFTEMLYNVEMFERALHAMGTPLHENPWYMTTATSSGQAFKLQLTKDTKNLPEELPKIEQQICELNTSFNLEIPDTWSGIRHGIHSVNEILSLPLFPYAWASNETITSLITRANSEHQRTQKYIEDTKTFTAQYSAKAQIGKQHTDHLRRCQNLLHTDWTQDVWQLDVSDIRSRYQNNYGDAEKSVRSVIQSAAEGSKCALATLQDILGLYDIANKLLRINRPDSISNIRFVADLASMLSDAPYMESTWFDPRKNAEIVPLIDEACQHSEAIQERTAKLLEHWEDDVLTLDADSMLARFKTEHTGLFHKFKATYKEDIKTLKVLAKQVGVQISEEDAVKLLNAVKDLNDEKEWFLKNKESLTAVFNRQFRGVETDWSKLRYGVRAALDIANMFPYANIPADVITAIQEAIDSTQKSAQLRQVNAELTREKIETLIGELADLSYIDFVDEDLPLSGSYLPKLEEAIASCHEQEEYLNTISACRVSGKEELTYSDIVNMLDLVAEIYTAQRWFKSNHASFTDMFGNQYTGADTDWDTIASKMDIGQSSYMRELTESFNTKAPELEEMFGSRYVGTETKWLGVAQELSQIKECLESIDDQSAITDEFISLVCNSSETREAVKQRISQLSNAVEHVSPALDTFLALFSNGDDHRYISVSAIAERYTLCMNSFDKLDKWIDYTETKQECDKLGLSPFTDAIENADNTVKDVKNAFELAFYSQWIVPALEQTPMVHSFRRRVHEQRLEKFVALDEAQFAIARDQIREKIIRTFPDPYGVSGPKSEIGILKHEMEKKRRIMPLRKLFRTIPNLLLTLKPCLMMSPLSVAYFLEADSYHFDMVIFDEASQIFPQDAIGAILRADQVIIAGDTKQLPPTNFFASSTGNGTDDYDLDEDSEYEDELYDSILEETANILPNRWLRWHYRSKSEHLIAFSNQEIYQNDLVTFPSVNEKEIDAGVEFIHVEEGYYEGGGKNCNILEARRCVELVASHIEKHPDRSLGIIAFSEKQQMAISREIQLFREKNPKYEEFFKEGKEEEFFIKNLENVQGDERDTIIFSVGYAKTKDQKAKGKPMAMRFGPLGVQGGERRLNVAITRAKRNIKLVSSILPSDIDLTRTESEGIRMLHDYIAFAMNGTMKLAAGQKQATTDEFRISVADFLRAHNFIVRESIGCSGYKIDIAVKHPSAREEYVAGIECDGISYVSARTARDRDRLRKSVLTSMGWRMYRVWSTEWYKNPEIEGQKLLDFVNAAIAEIDERIRQEEEIARIAEEKKKAELERIRLEKEKAEWERQLEAQKQQEAEQLRIAEFQRTATEKKSRQTKERAERKAKEDQAKKDAAKRKAEAEKQKQAQVTAKNPAKFAWVKPGVRVNHNVFGVGTISSIEGSVIVVAFDSGNRNFSYPDSFEKGFLSQVIHTSTDVKPETKKPSGFQEEIKSKLAEINVEYIYEDDSCGLFKDNAQTNFKARIICREHGAKAITAYSKAGVKFWRVRFEASSGAGDALISKLISAGFQCVDNRATSDILWVYYNGAKAAEFESIVSSYKKKFTFERRGSVATGNKPAWRIMM